MSCLNDRRQKDIDYVKTKANQFSKIVKKDVAIFQVTRAGVGKVYDFIELDKCQMVPIETIRYKLPDVDFQKYTSPDILRDSGKSKIRKTGNKKKKANEPVEKDSGKPMVSDIGKVLHKDQPGETPDADSAIEPKKPKDQRD